LGNIWLKNGETGFRTTMAFFTSVGATNATAGIITSKMGRRMGLCERQQA
jgi:hypothetical protein